MCGQILKMFDFYGKNEFQIDPNLLAGDLYALGGISKNTLRINLLH